jgi:site-specific DNA-methyltransferase (cytosine-N4-specific)
MSTAHAMSPDSGKPKLKRGVKSAGLHSTTGPRSIKETRQKKKTMGGGSKTQKTFIFVPTSSHPSVLVPQESPLYKTDLGVAYVADSLQLMREIPSSSIAAVITSPPYALHFKKEYGNVDKAVYVEWFLPFAREIKRILKPDGSFVLNIGGSYNQGRPTRSLYHFRLLVELCDTIGYHLAQECFWYNPAKLPAPAEWVNVRRVRVKDSVEYIWWLSPSEWPKANNRAVLLPYSDDMERLIKRGYRAKKRPSGHNITGKFRANHNGSIPSNLISRGNNESNSAFIRNCSKKGLKLNPARFPSALPEFFIKLTTEPGDIVLDPFAGSNTTGSVAENLQRRWLAIEIDKEYLRASGLRFDIEL